MCVFPNLQSGCEGLSHFNELQLAVDGYLKAWHWQCGQPSQGHPLRCTDKQNKARHPLWWNTVHGHINHITAVCITEPVGRVVNRVLWSDTQGRHICVLHLSSKGNLRYRCFQCLHIKPTNISDLRHRLSLKHSENNIYTDITRHKPKMFT